MNQKTDSINTWTVKLWQNCWLYSFIHFWHAPNLDILLSGQFWATSSASFREMLLNLRFCCQCGQTLKKCYYWTIAKSC